MSWNTTNYPSQGSMRPNGSYPYFTTPMQSASMNQLPTAFGHQRQPQQQQQQYPSFHPPYQHQQQHSQPGSYRGGGRGGFHQSRGGGGGFNRGGRGGGGRGGGGDHQLGGRGRGGRGGGGGRGRGGFHDRQGGGSSAGEVWMTPNFFDYPWKHLLTPEELARSSAKPVPLPASMQQSHQHQQRQPYTSSAESTSLAQPMTDASSIPSNTSLDPPLPLPIASNKRARSSDGPTSLSPASTDFIDEDAPPESDDDDQLEDEDEKDPQFELFKQDFTTRESINAAANTNPTRSMQLPPPSTTTPVASLSPHSLESKPPPKSFMQLPPPKHS